MEIWKFYCGECDHRWTKKYEFYSDIDWTCPKCNKDTKIWVVDYIPKKPTTNDDVILGVGGCRQK